MLTRMLTVLVEKVDVMGSFSKKKMKAREELYENIRK